MSITVPLEGFGGGGGASLNFDVKAYATEEALLAATPSKYTVGIITEVPLNGWAFTATEPTEPVEGMVWITTGTSSPIEFNALKKNSIQVYPLAAKQYVSGAWIDVTAMSYQGGEWVTWLRYLYNNGVENVAWTGSWTEASTYFYGQDYTTGKWHYLEDMIDLTRHTTLHAIVAHTKPSGTFYDYMKMYVCSDIPTGSTVDSVASTSVPNGMSKGEITLDISDLTGSYYIAFKAGRDLKSDGVSYVYEVWLS